MTPEQYELLKLSVPLETLVEGVEAPVAEEVVRVAKRILARERIPNAYIEERMHNIWSCDSGEAWYIKRAYTVLRALNQLTNRTGRIAPALTESYTELARAIEEVARLPLDQPLYGFLLGAYRALWSALNEIPGAFDLDLAVHKLCLAADATGIRYDEALTLIFDDWIST